MADASKAPIALGLPAALAGTGFSAAGAFAPPNDSRRRRATGASTVDDAERLSKLQAVNKMIAEDMPDIAAGTYAIAFGDFAAGYTIAERPDLRVLRDPYSAKPYVLFYTTKRVGGGVQNFDAIKVMKFAAS